MNYLPQIITVAGIHLLAVMSPGPDFIMISRNSLVYSRRVGIYSAIGLGLGILVHVTYSLVGIGLIISKSILLFSVLKFLGAGYLMYIGYKSLRANPEKIQVLSAERQGDISKAKAIRLGFLTNVLNPKATLFFFALFTQVINPNIPKSIQTLMGIEMSMMTFIWFALVATVLSHKHVKNRFISVQHYFERTFGLILIGLGIKVALSSK